jgi:hypothetical protein
VLDGKAYPVIKQDSVPSGMVEVDVLVKDSGKEHDTVVVAGCVGMTVQKGVEGDEEGKEGDTVQPRSGWFMVEGPKKTESA